LVSSTHVEFIIIAHSIQSPRTGDTRAACHSGW